ncbi:MAG: hypothetical protein II028_00170 [Clostridia bacterium]|jgi:hypothetical protein|nr:hypothetical protein [Clostridia bacterium]
MQIVSHYNCYDYNESWYLVEMLIDELSSEIDWMEFYTPQEGVDRENYQVPWMEQYLNEEGTKPLCPAFDEPEEPVRPSRVAFFLFKIPGADVLHTPYGDYKLGGTEELPARLKSMIEFEEPD